jgi:hypothetical protein
MDRLSPAPRVEGGLRSVKAHIGTRGTRLFPPQIVTSGSLIAGSSWWEEPRVYQLVRDWAPFEEAVR